MFSFRKWVSKIAIDAARYAVDEKWQTISRENAAEPVNIDSELDDGIILLYAREKRLLPAKEWRVKALAWQKEFYTEGILAGPITFTNNDVFWHPGRDEKTTPVAVAMRRAILEANVEIAEAEQKAATDALKAAKKAVKRA